MQAIRLAEQFRLEFKRKYMYPPYSMKDVTSSKWWHFFINFCNKSKIQDGYEESFIKMIFGCWDKSTKMYPYVLSTDYAKDKEVEFIGMKDSILTGMTENEFIKETLNKISLWSRQNKITENKIGKFLTDKVCIYRALRGEFYKPLFLFSAPFLERYGNMCEDDLLKKSSIRTFHKGIYEALRQSLGDDFAD